MQPAPLHRGRVLIGMQVMKETKAMRWGVRV
jgi:hypothetical protein